jgi:hypothetical protein
MGSLPRAVQNAGLNCDEHGPDLNVELITLEPRVSQRLDKSWLVCTSQENAEHDRCVDIFRRTDASFGFEEFRRDPEDAGRWTPVHYFSDLVYGSEQQAVAAAAKTVRWFGEQHRLAN